MSSAHRTDVLHVMFQAQNGPALPDGLVDCRVEGETEPCDKLCSISTPRPPLPARRILRYTCCAVKSTPLPSRYSQFGATAKDEASLKPPYLFHPVATPASQRVWSQGRYHSASPRRQRYSARGSVRSAKRARQPPRRGPRSRRSSTRVLSGYRSVARDAAIRRCLRFSGRSPLASRR
jgi:hypothetical protein